MGKRLQEITGFVDLGQLGKRKRATLTIAVNGEERIIQTSPIVDYFAGSVGVYIETKNTIYRE